MGLVKTTTVRVIDKFVSVTIPSLPAITDLQLALNFKQVPTQARIEHLNTLQDKPLMQELSSGKGLDLI